MKSARLFFVAALTSASTLAAAGARELPEVTDAALLDTRFTLIQEKGGKVALMSEEGRYLITGFTLVDTWHSGVQIKTPEQLRKVAVHLPVEMIPYEQLMALYHPGANPSLRLTIFIDPHVDASRKAIAEVVRSGLPAALLPVPFSGPQSEETAKRLSCALQAKQSDKALKALISGNYSGLPPETSCADHTALRNNVIAAQQMGAHGTPFIVASDGRFIKGLPADLKTFATPVASARNLDNYP